MKKRVALALTVVVLAAAVMFLLLSKRLSETHAHGRFGVVRGMPPKVQPPTSDSPADAVTADEQHKVGLLVQAFNAPIQFYGQVVDQYGQPVAGATIHYSAADRYFGESSKYQGMSDANGFFSIKGITGADSTLVSINRAMRA